MKAGHTFNSFVSGAAKVHNEDVVHTTMYLDISYDQVIMKPEKPYNNDTTYPAPLNSFYVNLIL